MVLTDDQLQDLRDWLRDNPAPVAQLTESNAGVFYLGLYPIKDGKLAPKDQSRAVYYLPLSLAVLPECGAV